MLVYFASLFPFSMSDSNAFLTAALQGAPPVAASITRQASALMQWTFSSSGSWPPAPVSIALEDLEGLSIICAAYSIVRVASISIIMPKIPKADYHVVCAITNAGWGQEEPGVFKAKCFDHLSIVEGRAVFTFQAANTSVENETASLRFPVGISNSIKPVFPGLLRPAFTVAVASFGSAKPTFADGTKFNAYIDITVECSGHAYLGAY
jgi:hypothetical protein